ncbi:MAG TPA: PEGA domain-containing protein [Planctomycetota bacterium]|nr:PEGA domain-containing protein [Planctomycetota bacterium]
MGSNPTLPATLSSRRAARVALLLPLALALALCGCVSRKLFLQSEPPGAAVFLDGRRVGTTPWEGDYESYGARRVELEKPGYARRIETIELDMPWWAWPGPDLVVELLLPWTVNDDRSFAFDLAPLDPDASTWEDAYEAVRRMDASP